MIVYYFEELRGKRERPEAVFISGVCGMYKTPDSGVKVVTNSKIISKLTQRFGIVNDAYLEREQIRKVATRSGQDAKIIQLANCIREDNIGNVEGRLVIALFNSISELVGMRSPSKKVTR